MLTKEQQAIRLTGVGASEVAALVGLHPYRGPLDVWMEKPTPSRGPLYVPDQDEGGYAKSAVGEEIEAGLLALCRRRTGVKMARPRKTLRHPKFPHVLASPDGLGPRKRDPGAEIKVVGARMAHHWEGDTIPDYVMTQVAQNMAVTGRGHWIVCALVGGTDFRVYTVERDLDLEQELCEAVETFWAEHVEADVQPEPNDIDELRRYLRARYPGSSATKCRALDIPEVHQLAGRLRDLTAQRKAVEAEEAAAEATLCELVGADYGVEGLWGKFLWYPVRGKVNWKAVAEELACGAVNTDVIDRHRGNPYRVPKLYEPKQEKSQ